MTAAVITGVGAMAPTGTSCADHWSACLAGEGGLAVDDDYRAAGYRSVVRGAVTGFSARDHIPSRLVVQTDRWTQFGLATTAMALRDATLDPGDLGEFDVGVVTGASSGGNEFGQRQIEVLWSEHPDHVSAFQSIAWFYAATTGQVSIRHVTRGPSGVVVSEQAAGLDALGQARRLIAEGTPVVLAGGTEAPLSPYAHACQEAAGSLTADPDPATAFRPFAADADGYVPGEGGAMFVVESAESAHDRGASVHAEIAGYAASFDPPPGVDAPDGLRIAIERALADAGRRPDQIDVVFADGSGVPERDRAESAALAAVFGPHGVPVTVPKTLTGRLYAGGSALDVATAVECLRHQVVPPTTGVDEIAPEHRIDLVTTSRRIPVHAVLVLARGHGGFNSAMVLTTPGGRSAGFSSKGELR